MVGYYSLGLCGYAVLDIEYGVEDYVIWKPTGVLGLDKTHRTKVYYSAIGRAYFMANGRRVYLDECMVQYEYGEGATQCC